jgi:Tfp pilus assembly protein PilF
MKRLFVIILLTLTVQLAKAQPPRWKANPQIKQLSDQALKFKQTLDYVDAAKTYLAAFNLDTTNYEAANSMAGVMGNLYNYNTQLIWAQKAIKLNPKFAAAYANLGDAYLGKTEYPLAQQNYQTSARLDPKNPYPIYTLGMIQQRQGNIKQAVGYYERCQTIDNDYYDAFYNMALCYDQLKDYNNAYKYIDRCQRVETTKKVLALWRHMTKEIAAQPFAYPTLAATGKTLNDFVPAGWKIKGKTTGDLNGDKIPDAALVLEYKTITAEVREGNDTIYSYPRILLVLFKNGDHYSTVAQHNTFMLRAEEGDHMSGDPYDTIEISKGILNINYEYTRTHLYYKFRYQNNGLYLIGATMGGAHLDTVEVWDINFPTHTMEHIKEPISGPSKKIQVIKLNLPRLKTLNELKEPYMWEVAKDVMI